jgi:lipoprotein-releasing system permease protein
MSRLPFELVLALRYLRPKRTFVSVITLISILGVTLGVAVLIIVIAVMSGFDQQLREKILGFSTHLKVLGQGRALGEYAHVAATVRSNAQVIGVAPFVLGKVLLETQPQVGEQSLVDTPFVRGVDPATESSVSVLPGSIIRGDFNLEGRTVVVGSELARHLDLRVGSRLAIYSPEDLKKWRAAQNQERPQAPMAKDYTVRGIFDVGYYEYNANVMVTSLENAQELYALDEADEVHGLMVMLKDPDRAAEVRAQLIEVLGPGVFISIWTEENSFILDALAVEKNMMFYLLFFIMIVAALCIMSALITFVVQKTREIGMLKALGATNGQVAALFLSQSAIVGVIGVLAGFGLGMLALAYRNEFLHFMRRVTRFELFPAEIYNFSELPALIMPGDIVVICSSALVICLLAGLLPAWSASRLQPVEALRHE